MSTLRTNNFNVLQMAGSQKSYLANPVISQSVNVIDLHEKSADDNFTCIKTKYLHRLVQTTICLHDERDAVSNQIRKEKIWEERHLAKMLHFLTQNSHMSFIDVGANVGVYTMFAASLGRFVLSIECFKPNVDRIRKAIQIEKLQNKVVLVGNAIFSESDKSLKLTSDPHNVGSQTLLLEDKLNSTINDTYVVKTIRFDDILPILKQRNIRNAIMKVDIQWSEVFLCQTANKTFEYVNIPVVLMEWETVPRYKIILSMSIVLNYFILHGYSPTSDMCRHLKITDAFKSWPKDIFWIKTNETHSDSSCLYNDIKPNINHTG